MRTSAAALTFAFPMIVVAGGNPTAIFSTDYGEIRVELFEDDAPETVENFRQYINDERYEGMFFHRLAFKQHDLPFVLQAGWYAFDGQTGLSRVAELPPLKNEFNGKNSNLVGTLGMARLAGKPDSGTSSFFFNLDDNSDILDDDKTHGGIDDGFCVFGRVISGIEVLEAIEGLEVVEFVDPNDPLTKDLKEVPVTPAYLGGEVLEGSFLVYCKTSIDEWNPCPPDLDGDGKLDLFDFLTFGNLFNLGNLAADFDGDGVLTLFDFLAFVNFFAEGC